MHFAIMCNGFEFKQWQADAILSLINTRGINLSLLIINDSSEGSEGLENKLRKYPYNNLLWRFYKRFFFHPESDKLVNLSEELINIPLIKCRTELRGKHSEYFSNEDIKNIKDKNLDFIVRFGFNIIRGEILNSARFGVWSFHHGDEQKYRGGPPGLWEIYYNDNATGVVLQRLTEKLDAGVILKKGHFKTINHSYRANLDNILKGASGWIKQQALKVQCSVTDVISSDFSSDSSAKIYTFPNNRQMVVFLWKLFVNKIRFHFNELFLTEQWNIGIIEKPIQTLLSEDNYKINWLPKQPARYFRADAFGYIDTVKLNIIFEDYSYRTRIGHISQFSIPIFQLSDLRHLILNSQFSILNSHSHHAYPYIFRIEDNIYCIPESAEDRRIDLYKIETTSVKAIFIKTLIEDIDAVDSTLFNYGGLWWLFFTRKEYDSNINLFAYFSESFDGEYKPHLNNPIKTDISSARPAGTPFMHEGNLYRPSQDSSATYGGAVKINRIIKLNPFEFEEVTGKVIFPDRNSLFNKGIHTLSSCGDYTIVDGKRFVFSWYSFWYRLKIKAKNLKLKAKNSICRKR